MPSILIKKKGQMKHVSLIPEISKPPIQNHTLLKLTSRCKYIYH